MLHIFLYRQKKDMILAGPYIYNSGHNKRYAAGIKQICCWVKKIWSYEKRYAVRREWAGRA